MLKRDIAAIATLFACLSASHSSAMPFTLSADITTIASSGFLLDLAIYDVNGVTGDSRLWVDNVRLYDSSNSLLTPPGILDFEAGDLSGFDVTLNPASVTITDGGWGGSKSLLLSEDPTYYAVVADRSLQHADAARLVFDLEFEGSSVPGTGYDTFAASFLDPITFAPLVSGLTGAGDFFESTYEGYRTASGVSVTPIGANPVPEPAAVWLLGTGILSVALLRKRRS